MSRESKLVKNTAILSIGTFLPKLTTFITLPILTACLSKEQYGTYDLVTILASLILPVTTLQIHTAAFRFLVGKKNNRDLAKTYLSNILAFVIPIAILTLSILYFLIPTNSGSVKLWVCIYLFFDTIAVEVRQITRGLSRNIDYSISGVIGACAQMGLALLLVQFLHFELIGAIIALTASTIALLLFLCYRIKIFDLIDFKLVSKNVLKEMLSYSWPMVPNNLSSWVMRVSDRFVVTAIMGLPANAVYSVANKIPHMLTIAESTFAMAWQENASVVSGDQDAGNYYSKMFSVMIKFYAGSLGLIISFTPVLFKLLIKGDYSEAYYQMPILFMAMFFSCMASFQGGIYIAKKETKSVGITTILAAISNLIIDIVLIRKIGLYAASGSTLFSYFFLFIYRTINIRKFVQVKYKLSDIVLSIFVIMIECTLFYINTQACKIINVCIGFIAFTLLNWHIIKKVGSKFAKKK